MDLRSVTSSQDSEDGAWLSELLGCETTSESGPPVARASLSARQAREQGLLMSGTSGQPSSTSPASAALQDLLVSRLQVRTQSLGSTLYKLTWKPWAMPSGRSRFRLRASVLRTSETARTGWPTPVARDHMPAHTPEYIAEKVAQGHGMANLNDRVQLAGWTTPTTRDWKDSGADIKPRNDTGKDRFDQLPRQANLAGWPTPSAHEFAGNPEASIARKQARGIGNTCTILSQVATLCGPARLTATGQLLTGSDAGMESGGQLNPAHSLWLMACPPALAHSAPGSDDWLRWQGLMQQVLSERKLTAPGCSPELEMLSTSKPQESLSNACTDNDLTDLLGE